MNGNTGKALNFFLNQCKEIGHINFQTFHVYQMDINYCDGCYACFEKSTNDRPCPTHDDDMHAIYPQLKKTNAVVIASPVFYGCVSAKLKTFME